MVKTRSCLIHSLSKNVQNCNSEQIQTNTREYSVQAATTEWRKEKSLAKTVHQAYVIL